jgi:uncharacterized protein (DUF1697 family)
MIYAALLRGINVGGKNRVEMPRLKLLFEGLGFSNATTYINSGNVVFESSGNPAEISNILQKAIAHDFGFVVPVLLRDLPQIKATASSLKDSWVNDATQKCDVLFLWDAVDNKDILKQLKYNPSIEDVVYVAGAVLWRIDRKDYTKTSLSKIVGTSFYNQVTIRNANTVRKLQNIMQLGSM